MKPCVNRSGLTAVIFDLDNCLSAAAEVGESLYAPAFDAIRRANDGSVSQDDLEKAFADMWTHAFDWVAERHRFTPAMFSAGWKQFTQIEMRGPMKGYADLRLLPSVPGEKFLVTSGFRRLQESKISALGIASEFREVHIDAIDKPDRMGKKRLFQDIVARHGFDTGKVFVVGDNPESEIAAGNELGFRTVQILRPGVRRTGSAMYHVDNLSGLVELLQTVQ